MDENRRAALTAGVIVHRRDCDQRRGDEPVDADPERPGLPDEAFGQHEPIACGELLELIAAAASAGIAISLYPVMRKVSGGLALGSVAFRTMEAVLYVIGVIALLSMLSVSRQFTAASVADRSGLQAAGAALLAIREQAAVPAVLACSFGA